MNVKQRWRWRKRENERGTERRAKREGRRRESSRVWKFTCRTLYPKHSRWCCRTSTPTGYTRPGSMVRASTTVEAPTSLHRFLLYKPFDLTGGKCRMIKFGHHYIWLLCAINNLLHSSDVSPSHCIVQMTFFVYLHNRGIALASIWTSQTKRIAPLEKTWCLGFFNCFSSLLILSLVQWYKTGLEI